MARELKGLENQLTGVDIGDLLYLYNEKGDRAGGFVKVMDSRSVVLSHEPATNKRSYLDRYFPRLSLGDRKYFLSFFDKYTVINLDSE